MTLLKINGNGSEKPQNRSKNQRHVFFFFCQTSPFNHNIFDSKVWLFTFWIPHPSVWNGLSANSVPFRHANEKLGDTKRSHSLSACCFLLTSVTMRAIVLAPHRFWSRWVKYGTSATQRARRSRYPTPAKWVLCFPCLDFPPFSTLQ